MCAESEKRGYSSGRLTTAQLDGMVRELDALPVDPAVSSRLVELLAEPQADSTNAWDRVVAVIRTDPAMSARLLTMAGDAGSPARTIVHAIETLGRDAVAAAILTQAAHLAGMDIAEFRRHSLATACAAELIARRLAMPIDPAEAYTCGLLHDIGKLVLAAAMPKSYARAIQAAEKHNANIAEFERKIIGHDHTVVGRRFAEHRHFSNAIEETLWLHHQPFEAIPETVTDRHLIAVVSLADTIAREQRCGFSGNFTFPRPSSLQAQQMGLSQADLDQIAASLAGEVASRCRTHETASHEDKAGGETLAMANAAMGRLNDELLARSQKLADQARAFELMHSFFSDVRPDASVTDVLLAIARAAASCCRADASRSQPVVAYSLEEHEKFVTALRWEGGKRISVRTFDCADTAAAAMPGNAVAAINMLLAEPADFTVWLNPGAYTHMPLTCAGRYVGGAFVPAETHNMKNSAAGDFETIAGAMSFALAAAQDKQNAKAMSEQLAAASQVLAETQESLAEAKTLAAIGEMAAGAAHELNNPLAVISGRAQLMRDKAGDDAAKKTWQLIADQAHRISDIISQLMEYANPPVPVPSDVNPLEILSEAIEAFSSSDHPQAASLQADIEVGGPVPLVRVDAGQLRAVVVELITNAANATKTEPQLSLTTEADDTNGTVLISVKDNGPGMDEQVLARAFTPFYSSQQAGRRNGLGLPRAKRFVESNGGRMWISSAKGKGTTVHIELPQAKARQLK